MYYVIVYIVGYYLGIYIPWGPIVESLYSLYTPVTHMYAFKGHCEDTPRHGGLYSWKKCNCEISIEGLDNLNFSN